MSSAGSARVYVDIRRLKSSLEGYIDGKIGSLTNDSDLYVQIATTYAEHLMPFVPYSSKPRDENHTKHLADFTVNKSDGIVYSSKDRGFDYARKQYDGPDADWNRDKSIHPDARSDWNGYDVQEEIWDDFVEDVTPIIIEHFKRA